MSTQAIAPGALLVALGAMLLSGSVAASEQPKVRVADLLMMSPEVIDCVASFLAFTFIAIWVTFTTLSLGMFQTGALAQEEFGRS